MAKYIEKAALVAEIKRYKHKADERLKMKNRTLSEDMKDLALQNLCGNLLHFIDTLEVKEVNLDFENELYKAFGQIKDFTLGMRIAKHFFELGLKAKEEVTTTDTFINKACEWLRNNMYEGTCEQMLSKKPYPFMSNFIDEFKQAMKGE